MPCSSVGWSCPLPAPPIKRHWQVLGQDKPLAQQPSAPTLWQAPQPSTNTKKASWCQSGSKLGKLCKALSTQTIRSKQACRMRNSCFQVRWYFKRHSQHVSCCLLSHFTPCCQTFSFILRKQMEKRKLFPACSHPGSHQGPPSTAEVQRLTVRAAKDLSAPMQKITSSWQVVHHTLKEEPSTLPATASKLSLEKQEQVLNSSKPAHG